MFSRTRRTIGAFVASLTLGATRAFFRAGSALAFKLGWFTIDVTGRLAKVGEDFPSVATSFRHDQSIPRTPSVGESFGPRRCAGSTPMVPGYYNLTEAAKSLGMMPDELR